MDFEAIEDPTRRAATEATIANFGQTPCQLLTRRHPPRSAGGKYGPNDWTRFVIFFCAGSNFHLRHSMFSPSRQANQKMHRIGGVGNGNIMSVLTVREGIETKDVPGHVLSVGGSMGSVVESGPSKSIFFFVRPLMIFLRR